MVVVGSADRHCRAWRLGSGESGGWRGRGGAEGGDVAEKGEDGVVAVAGVYGRLTGMRWASATAVSL